jgi:RNA 2',3'-cyclic 3'-phosphodiesterase
MRIFIAVELPSKTREKIDTIITYLKNQLPNQSLKWVGAENLHLTVKFIGEFPEEKLSNVTNIIDEVLAHQPAFSISIEGLGMFPNSDNPRVIWLGIRGGDPLISIHQQLNQSLAQIGVKPDQRPLSPHLTIARVRQGVNRSTLSQIGISLSEFRVDPLDSILIDHMSLFQSILKPTDPHYKILYSQQLNQV